ncbi:unnamed protein product [Trichobilharzia regenti]|nr:unnamed protein product [Trichobilharzia regenti]
MAIDYDAGLEALGKEHILEVFIQRSGPTRKGFSAFIQQALAKMPEYEVADDLECYKAVIRIFPTGRMTVTRYLQAEFGHYPRQQQRMIDVLNQMTDNRKLKIFQCYALNYFLFPV